MKGRPASDPYIGKDEMETLIERQLVRRPIQETDLCLSPAVYAALPRLCEALESSDWGVLLSFLDTPLGSLEGLTPRLAIEMGQLERVLSIAGYDD